MFKTTQLDLPDIIKQIYQDYWYVLFIPKYKYINLLTASKALSNEISASSLLAVEENLAIERELPRNSIRHSFSLCAMT